MNISPVLGIFQLRAETDFTGVVRGTGAEAGRRHFGPFFCGGGERLFCLKCRNVGLCWFGGKYGRWRMQIVAGVWTVYAHVCLWEEKTKSQTEWEM